MLNFFVHGIFELSILGYIGVILATTHITILATTIYLHRAQAHRALTLHPCVSHFFRFWLWFNTGQVTKEWIAIHRKHHAFADKAGDPHSPHIYGINQLLLQGHELYSKESKNLATLAQYGTSAPEDWLERNIYTPHSYTGIYILLVLNIILFGFIGITIWAVQMLWIPIFAAGIINGIGHWFGYRNFECPDHARNIVPFGILIGGEELHNNHHTFITSAKFSVKWYEFDYGYLWIKVLVMLKLASIKKTIPKLQLHANISPTLGCYEQLERIISNRYMLIITFAKVLKAEYLFELRKTNVKKISWRSAKMLLIKEILSATERDMVNQVCKISPVLHKIFDMRAELATFWQRSSLTKEDLLYKINTWCHQADNSQIHGLRYYALCLRSIA